jgi:hypothetical protein
MDQFNSDTYKKQGLLQQFFHSCLGRFVILLIILFGLYIFALITVPSKQIMLVETVDNVHECLQENDSIKADEIDEFINNISRSFSVADTTKTNQEVFKAFLKYNNLEVFSHPGFKTIYLFNSMYPQGCRIGIGVFQSVFSTLRYEDLVLSNGAARGDYGKKLNAPTEIPDDEEYNDIHVEPYHYQGNPED